MAASVPSLVPVTHHPLHGFRLKLNRAKAYAEALNREIDAWFERHPYEVFGEYQPGSPEQYVFKVRFLEPVPPDLGIVLGDFAHNARSALDHLAYQVVLAGTGGQHREQTQFPILINPWEWTKVAKSRLKGATPRHVEIIESFQPYNRTDTSDWHTIYAAIEDPLAVLNRLSNVDKHLVLNAMPAILLSIGWECDMVRDVASIVKEEAPMGIIADESDLVRVEIISSGPEPEMKLDRTETVEIWVEHQVKLWKNTHTTSRLPLKQAVDAILSRLREIFQVFVNEFR